MAPKVSRGSAIPGGSGAGALGLRYTGVQFRPLFLLFSFLFFFFSLSFSMILFYLLRISPFNDFLASALPPAGSDRDGSGRGWINDHQHPRVRSLSPSLLPRTTGIHTEYALSPGSLDILNGSKNSGKTWPDASPL